MREGELKEQYLRQAKTSNDLREELASSRRQLESAQRQLALSTQFIEQHLKSHSLTEVEHSAPPDNPLVPLISPENSHIAAHEVTPESETIVISPIRPAIESTKRRGSGAHSIRRPNTGDTSPGLRAEVKATISLIDRLLPSTSTRSLR